MRVCVFSDIHGNHYALRSFAGLLPSLQIDSYVFCGDIFGYYYGQEETFKFLSSLPNFIWLLGNHDKYFINTFDGTADVDSLSEKYGNSYKHAALLSNRTAIVEDLRKLPLKAELNYCGKRVVAVHGTLDEPLNGRLYPKAIDFLKELRDVDVCIMGNTHFRLYKQAGKTVYINPGSLGQPRDGQKACFAMLTLPECSVEFVNVQYNIPALETEIRQYDANNEKLLELLHRSN